MAKRRRTYSARAVESAELLGARVRLARLGRGWRLSDVARQIDATPNTVAKIERGDPSVGLGVALDAAALFNIGLFDRRDERRAVELARVREQLERLPRRARIPRSDGDL